MLQLESVRKVIRDEFEQFRCKILELPKEAVFEQCNRIRFYSCIHEYFTYNEKIPKRILLLVDSGAVTICGAWMFYLKHESYSYETWEGISEIIFAMYSKSRWRKIKDGCKRIDHAVCG